MIRRPRAREPPEKMKRLSEILHPIVFCPWESLAMHFLGVPIIVIRHSIVVGDEHYHDSMQKLRTAGFEPTVPDRRPNSAILARIPNPEAVVSEFMAGFASLDNAASSFKYPDSNVELVLVPNSFACLPRETAGDSSGVEIGYESYGNIMYPLEKALVESFVRCALLEESPGITEWGMLLMSHVSKMLCYLDIENDILDACPDSRAIQWYSEHFGREHEAKHGPPDLRISKRIGSGKELTVNSRGNTIV